MTVSVTSDELKAAIQDADVTALIVSKIKDAKTNGLDAAVASSLAALFPDSTDPSPVGEALEAVDGSIQSAA